MLAEDTNERFHYLTQHQRTHRLSTAFDGPTLYGIDSDADGVFGKIGEGGVAIDTVEDMVPALRRFRSRLTEFFRVDDYQRVRPPIIMAMYIAAAKRRFGPKVVPKLRGTIQGGHLQRSPGTERNDFPIEASLRFLTDMVEFTTREMPRWYPISISGYHIGEAGSTPVQPSRLYALEWFRLCGDVRSARNSGGINSDRAFRFFLDCGLDVEYIAPRSRCRGASGRSEGGEVVRAQDREHSFSNCIPRPAVAR